MNIRQHLLWLTLMETSFIVPSILLGTGTYTGVRLLKGKELDWLNPAITSLACAVITNLGSTLAFNLFQCFFSEETENQKKFKNKYGTLLVFSIPLSTVTGGIAGGLIASSSGQ